MNIHTYLNKDLFSSQPLETVQGKNLEHWMIMYDKLGWISIPCFVYKSPAKGSKKQVDFGFTKEGKKKEWKDYPTQLDHRVDALRTFKAMHLSAPANSLAILTGRISNLLVLDIDERETGVKYLASLGIRIYENAYTVLSGSGNGLHVYYKFPQELEDVPTTLSGFFGDGHKIDIRGNGGLIFAPPSYCRDYGNDTKLQYKVEHPERHNLHVDFPPQNLINFLVNRPAERENNTTLNTERCKLELKDLTEKQKAWLEKDIDILKNLPKGEDRSKACYKTLCTFVRLGISPKVTRDLVKGISKFAERDESFFAVMWNNAVSEVGIEGRVKETRAEKNERLVAPIMTARDILAMDYTYHEPKKIWSPWGTAETLAIIMGLPGVGKTTLITDFVRGAVTGDMCWDGNVMFEDKMKVVMFQGELTFTQHEREYLNPFGLSYKNTDGLTIVNLLEISKKYNLPVGEDKELGKTVVNFNILDSDKFSIYNGIIRDKRPDIVIIDSMASFHTTDENDPVEMGTILTKLKMMSCMYPHIVILVHHIRKSSTMVAKKQFLLSLDDLRGSGNISAKSDWVLAVSPVYSNDADIQPIDGAGYVHPVKSGSAGKGLKRYEPFTYKIEDKDGLRLNYTYTGQRLVLQEEGKMDETKNLLLEFVKAASTVTELSVSAATDLIVLSEKCSQITAVRRLNEYEKDGYIVKEKILGTNKKLVKFTEKAQALYAGETYSIVDDEPGIQTLRTDKPIQKGEYMNISGPGPINANITNLKMLFVFSFRKTTENGPVYSDMSKAAHLIKVSEGYQVFGMPITETLYNTLKGNMRENGIIVEDGDTLKLTELGMKYYNCEIAFD